VARAVEYWRELGLGVRYRVRFTKAKGKVLAFVVQFEVQRDGQWLPVIRYDTAHGFAHRDRYRGDGSVRHHEKLPVSDFNAAFTMASQDVRKNWKKWIAEFDQVPP
jgi:hypothetical protein